MTDQPTKTQLEGEVKVYQTEHAAAVKAYDAAVEAMSRARVDRSVTMEALLELSGAVNAAKATGDRMAALIASTNRRIANFDIIARGAERERIAADVKAHMEAPLTDERQAAIRATGIDRLTIIIDLVVDGKPVRTVSVKPSGAKLAGARLTGGNGRGFASKGAVKVDGVEYSSLNKAYVTLRAAADGKDPANVTPANSKSAETWLVQHKHTIA